MHLTFPSSTQACAAVVVAFQALEVCDALVYLIEEWTQLGIHGVSTAPQVYAFNTLAWTAISLLYRFSKCRVCKLGVDEEVQLIMLIQQVLCELDSWHRFGCDAQAYLCTQV